MEYNKKIENIYNELIQNSDIRYNHKSKKASKVFIMPTQETLNNKNIKIKRSEIISYFLKYKKLIFNNKTNLIYFEKTKYIDERRLKYLKDTENKKNGLKRTLTPAEMMEEFIKNKGITKVENKYDKEEEKKIVYTTNKNDFVKENLDGKYNGLKMMTKDGSKTITFELKNILIGKDKQTVKDNRLSFKEEYIKISMSNYSKKITREEITSNQILKLIEDNSIIPINNIIIKKFIKSCTKTP